MQIKKRAACPKADDPQKKLLLLCQILADIDGHSHDDDQALNDIGVRRVDIHELQSHLHQLKNQNADQNAGNSTNAAGGGNTADGAGCDASSS